MTERFETAKKGTEKYRLLLDGVPSEQERSLPIETLLGATASDEVTFSIRSNKDMPRFQLRFFLKSLLRTRFLVLLLFPLFYFLFESWAAPKLTSAEIFSILLGILISYAAIQLRVDRRDFESGYDLLRPGKEKNYLRSGMISVRSAKIWERRLAAMAVGTGLLPVMIAQERALAVILSIACIAVADRLGSAKQNRLLRDIFLSLVAGPLLAYGITAEISSLGFGFVWAVLIFFSLQIDHLENFFLQTKAGEMNFLNQAGFDSVGSRLWWTWGAYVLVYAIWSSYKTGMSVWIGTALILFFSSLSWKKQVMQLRSSLSSDLTRCSAMANQLVSLVLILWTFELFFKAWVLPLVFSWAS